MRSIISLLLWLSVVQTVFGQSYGDSAYKQKFNKADALIYNGAFKDALPLLEELHASDSSIANINYMLGLCHLNGSKNFRKAIRFLEQASKDVSKDFVVANWKQKKAPGITYLYLGRAYHYLNDLERAVPNYYNYRSFLDVDDIDTYNKVRMVIKHAENAIELVAAPVNVKITNLGEVVNTPFADYAPVIAADGQSLFFTSNRTGGTTDVKDKDGAYFDDIYVSARQDNGKWGRPSMFSGINTSGNEITAGITPDGQTIFILKEDNGIGNIYYSELKDNAWSVPAKMGGDINSASRETSATVSVDGNILIFASNRPGGYGGSDLWFCSRMSDGSWGLAKNLGSVVNTQYDEMSPFLGFDGKTLFFSSQGHTSMGGFDIFRSELVNGIWSEPQNLGYPINTSEDDLHFVLAADGETAIMSSAREGGSGETDIYTLRLTPRKAEAKAVARGEMLVPANDYVKLKAVISVKDATGNVIGSFRPNRSTGRYILLLNPGETYSAEYLVEGYEAVVQTIKVGTNAAYSETAKPIEVESVVFGAELLALQAEKKKTEAAALALAAKTLEDRRLAEEARLKADADAEANAKQLAMQEKKQAEVEKARLLAEAEAEASKLDLQIAEAEAVQLELQSAENEAKKAEEARLAQEAAAKKVAAEAAREAELAAEAKKAEEARLAQEAAAKKAAAEAAREAELAAEAKKAEETRLAQEAAAKKAASEAAREAELAAEAKKAEDARLAEEAAAKKAASEAAREAELSAEAKKAEDARLAEEAAAKQAASEAAREAALAAEAKKAEDARLAEEAAAKKAAADAAREAELAAEAKKIEETRLAEEAAAKQAAAARESELAAESKKAEDARLAEEAAAKQAASEAAREAELAAEAKKTEETRLAQEAAAKQAAAARESELAAEAKKAEEARLAQEAAGKKAAADAAREAELAAEAKKTEETRLAQEAAQASSASTLNQSEEALKRAALQKRLEELKKKKAEMEEALVQERQLAVEALEQRSKEEAQKQREQEETTRQDEIAEKENIEAEAAKAAETELAEERKAKEVAEAKAREEAAAKSEAARQAEIAEKTKAKAEAAKAAETELAEERKAKEAAEAKAREEAAAKSEAARQAEIAEKEKAAAESAKVAEAKLVEERKAKELSEAKVRAEAEAEKVENQNVSQPPTNNVAVEFSQSQVREVIDANHRLIIENESLRAELEQMNTKLDLILAELKRRNEMMELPLETYSEEAVQALTEGKKLILQNILFDYNKARLRGSSERELDKLAAFLIQHPDINLTVAGHTDALGEAGYNLRLSRSRAEAVVNHLVSKGVDVARLKSVGYGQTRPIARNTNPDGVDNPLGRQLNRRIEISVTKGDADLIEIREEPIPESLQKKP